MYYFYGQVVSILHLCVNSQDCMQQMCCKKLIASLGGQLDEPGYSCDTQRILSKLEEAHDIKTIFNAVRVASILKIQKSLFRDSCLKDLGALSQREQPRIYKYSSWLKPSAFHSLVWLIMYPLTEGRVCGFPTLYRRPPFTKCV